MLLLGLKNNTIQALDVNENVNLGAVYRKYCKKCNGTTTFATTGSRVALQQSGIYHITAKLNISAAAAGNIILNLTENGDTILDTVTETISTATTEFRNVVFDYYVLVDTTCVLGESAINTKVITIQNVGIASTINNVIFNVEKVV